MTTLHELDRIAINVKARRLLGRLLHHNPKLDEIMRNSVNETEALEGVRSWILEELKDRPHVLAFYSEEHPKREDFNALLWRDYGAIRLLDYIDNANREFPDLNLRGDLAVTNPIRLIWLGATRGTGGAKPEFFEDMLRLFRQFSDTDQPKRPSMEMVEQWMGRYPSGLDPRIIALREENRDRILDVIVDLIRSGDISTPKFSFKPGLSRSEQLRIAHEWWQDHRFHLAFAVRSPDRLNEMLDHSLDPDTMGVLKRAEKAGIPFFVNPYYLSLLHVRVPYYAIGADLAIRDYVIYTSQLVDEFGHIVAWEKEDLVEPGKPNAAGWILPTRHNIHRRYPDVAILIPDTIGRACGGLCASCQRMYDFQRGNLNFNLKALRPDDTWATKLHQLMEYFRYDSQLRDILITGGDALMSSDISISRILEAIVTMAEAKRKDNQNRPSGEKFAEIDRVRLGTRLPVYIPQRITPHLTELLAEFKERAEEAGIKQFVIQTHFESPMEVTPEALQAVRQLQSAGWTVTNQLVFTAAASRRGHSAKLRQALHQTGVFPYYTFAVKGYRENQQAFAPIARLVQEEMEEKVYGSTENSEAMPLGPLSEHPLNKGNTMSQVNHLPFQAIDRSVLNLPGVGKSLTFRVIGITRYGRRILEFDHDRTRPHSPIIDTLGKVVVIESKSIGEYLRQLEDIGENADEYDGLYGYSLGQTAPRFSLYDYPDRPDEFTRELTNFGLDGPSR